MQNLSFYPVFSIKSVSIWIKICQEKAYCNCYIWNFNPKFQLTTPLVFSFSDTFGKIIKGIWVKYAKFFISVRTVIGTVDVNYNYSKNVILESSS